MSERELTTKVLKMLRAIPNSWWYKTSDRSTKAVPDIIGCWNSKLIAIEMKTPIGRVRPLQKFVIDEINKAGGVAGVCRSIDDVRKLLDKVK